jgi:formate dehydrogenase alpha subunit
MTNSISEIKDCDFLFVLGSNTTETHPIISLEMRKALNNGATLVVADPRKTEIAEMAHHHLALNAGANIPLLNAMANVIIAEELYDKEFVAGRTEGFEELKEAVANFTPEAYEGVIGVPADTIREVARGFAKARNGGIFYTMGITQHTSGTANVWTIANLAMLTGQIGKPSSGVNPLRGQNNVQGACDMGGLPNVFPGYQAVTDPNMVKKFSEAWGVPQSDKPGLTVGEIMDGAHHGDIKALFILGENPMLSDPDISHVQKALENLEFLVVQDLFLTETAMLADVVLPGASFAEKDGTYANTERRVQRVRKAIEPLAGKADWEVLAEIITRMGYPQNYTCAEDVFTESTKVTPQYGGMTYARLEEKGLQWPCPAPDHPGTKYLHEGKFSRGLGKFTGVDFEPPAELPDAEYPLVLNTGRRLYHYHTGTMTRRTKGLSALQPDEWIEINPADACKLGIESGEMVKVSSRRGAITIRAEITDRVKPGMVFTTFHFAEAAVNFLTNTARDPVAKIPELKVCAVKVEKVS